MKNFILLLLTLTLLLPGCLDSSTDQSESEPVNYEVHFQSNFSRDDVVLKIDNQNVFVGELTTDHTISVAKILNLQGYAGEHILSININNDYNITESFTLDEGLYILVRFFNDSIPSVGINEGINIELTYEQPVYD